MLSSYQAFFLLGLVVSVSAIDAYHHAGRNCDGAALVCTNLNPTVCCVGGDNPVWSIGYRGIPSDWTIVATAFASTDCMFSGDQQLSQGLNFLCLRPSFTPGQPFSSSHYDFTSSKQRLRRRDGSNAREPANAECLPGDGADTVNTTDEPCTSSQKPDQLVLQDGTTYHIAGLEDHVVGQLLDLAREGANIPAEFHSLNL